jgi:hypothetical protein
MKRKLLIFAAVLLVSMAVTAQNTFTAPLQLNDNETVEATFMVLSSTTAQLGFNDYRQHAVPETTAGRVVIPEVVNGYTITSIGAGAFMNCKGLTDVAIPETVTKIGYNAFRNAGLRSVTLPASVTSIGTNAFIGENILTLIVCKNNTPPTLDTSPFNTRNSTLVLVPKGSKSKYTSNSKWKSEGRYAEFDPNEVKTEGGFYYMMQPDSVAAIILGVIVYEQEDIVLPDYVEGNVPVTALYDESFYFNKSTRSISIGKNMRDLRAHAVYACDSLQRIDVDPENEVYCSVDGVLFSKNMYSLHAFPSGRSVPSNYTVPDGVQFLSGIGGEFYRSQLQEVVLPPSVHFIQTLAFGYAKKLTNMTVLHPTPPTLGGSVFMETNIRNGTLTVRRGSSGAFRSASQWKDFKNIVEVDFEEGNLIENSDFDYRINADVNTATLIKVNYRQATQTIPDAIQNNYIRVTALGDSVFKGDVWIKNLTLSRYIRSIGKEAFAGSYVKADMLKLDSVEVIDSAAFANCTLLTRFTLPDSIKQMGKDVFTGSGLMSVYTADSTVMGYISIGTKTEEFTVSEAVRRIMPSAIKANEILKLLRLPSKLEEVGAEAFHHCRALKLIYCAAPVPPAISTDSVMPAGADSLITLTVPVGSGNAYRQHPVWGKLTIREHDFAKPDTLAAPVLSRDENGYVIMNCEVPGAIIRYTTDGTTPTEQSSKFYKFANISQACTVKAVAMKDGWITSVESAIVLPPTIEKHPELIDEVNQCLDYISSLELLQQAVELSHDSLYNAMLAAGTAKYPPYEKDLSYTASRIVSLKTNVSSLLTSCMYPETFRLNLTDYTYSANYVKEELNRIWTAIRSQSNGIAGLKSSTNVTIRQYDLQGRIATGRRPAIVVEKVNTPGNLSVRKRVVK